MAPIAGGRESGRVESTVASETGRGEPELRGGAGQGMDGHLDAGHRQFHQPNAVDGTGGGWVFP